jgi:uncharacterized surface protein with fasciclin (FAS1) repeats
MYTKLIVSALASVALAQNPPTLTAALSGNSDLSSLAALIQTQPQLVAALGGASNITILAPNNAALNGVANSSLASNSAAVSALLSYHVLNGSYPASAVTNTSAFIPTLLTDTAYTNVTGGQVVEALLSHGNVSIITGLLQNSTVTQAVSDPFRIRYEIRRIPPPIAPRSSKNDPLTKPRTSPLLAAQST